MQQVGARIASVSPVEPGYLPVPQRKSSHRALAGAQTVWVLHKKIVVRLFAAALCCMLIVGLYQARTGLVTGFTILSDALQGEFAHAGFAIDEIKITGQALTPERDVLEALGLEPKTSTLNFDVAAALERLKALPSVSSATVRKVYPDQVVVSIAEKVPVARWRVDGVTFVVDARGEQIGEDRGAYSDLPLVVGDGAADDAVVMIRDLGRYPQLRDGLAALSRVGDRRWDLIYETGLRVQLPEQGVSQALAELSNLERDYQLLERDVSMIDLRVEGMLVVTPIKRDPEPANGKKPAKPASSGDARPHTGTNLL